MGKSITFESTFKNIIRAFRSTNRRKLFHSLGLKIAISNKLPTSLHILKAMQVQFVSADGADDGCDLGMREMS